MIISITKVEAGQMKGVNKMSDSAILYYVIASETRTQDQMLAVCHVIKNRVAIGGWFGDNIREVLLKPFQFSSLLPEVKDKMQERTPEQLNQAKEAWEIVNLPNNKSDFPATHFYDDSIPAPSWASKMKFLCKIDNQIFLQEKR